MRILHFSDIHVDIPFASVPVSDWLGKRFVGGANHLLRRRKYFLDVPHKMAALARFAQRGKYDLAICTGDYSVVGSMAEFRVARALVEPFVGLPRGFITIPGNHDIYTWDSVREMRFESNFSEFMQSDLPTGSAGLAVRLFESFAVVSVNSVRPNPPPWRSSGKIPGEVLLALRKLLAREDFRKRTVMVITHYALCKHDGRPDSIFHRLENVDELLAAVRGHPRLFVAHGHVHRRFHRYVEGVPVFGAGSATQAHREGLWSFEFSDGMVRATPGLWDGAEYRLETTSHALFGPANLVGV